MEQWKTITGFENYEVSNYGFVKRKKSKRLLKPEINPTGYMIVTLYGKSGKKRKSVHRLVCSEFNSLSEFLGAEVNHIDGDKTNNHLSNLEWVTHTENIRHAFKIGLIVNKCEHFRSSVSQYDINGTFIKHYESMTLATIETGAKNISACCRGLRKKSGGYIWKYKK
jgi:hypothetical protein